MSERAHPVSELVLTSPFLRGYWAEILLRHPGLPAVPPDFRDVGATALSGEEARLEVSADGEGTWSLWGPDAATRESTALAALAATLARIGRREGVAIGAHATPAAVPVLIPVEPGVRFAELARLAADELRGARARARYPLAHPASDIGRAARIAYPFFDVALECGGPRLSLRGVGHSIAVRVEPSGTALRVEVRFRESRYAADSMERLARAFLTALAAGLREGFRAADDLLAEPGELRAARADAPRADAPLADEAAGADPLLAAFAEQVKRAPGATAFVFAGERLAYGELDRRSARIAGALRTEGVRDESVVAICAPRGLVPPAAVLGVLRAGGAYLPLDPAQPPARLAAIARQAGARVVLTAGRAADGSWPENVVVLAADAASEEGPELREPVPAALPDALHSVLFTSGSTGRPRGVAITRRAVWNRLRWMWEAYPFAPGEVGVVVKLPTVVGAIWELFGALLSGHPSLIVSLDDLRHPAELWRRLAEAGVTRLSTAPSILEALLAELPPASGAPPLRFVSASAEPLSPSLALRWRERFPEAAFVNLYGSTEASSNVLAFDVSALPPRAARVPVGTPIAGCDAFVLDERLRAVPDGAVGELFLAGACLARGYLGDAALTAERFVPRPGGRPGERMYRTGDLGRRRSDGALEVLGRVDRQLKVQGNRIEPAEIERELRSVRAIRDCAVVERDGDGAALVAYVVADAGVARAALRRHLLAALPEYMVPSRLVRVAEIPRAASGKLLARLLPENGLAWADDADAPDEAGSETERAVCRVLADVLGLAQVRPADPLHELAANSLLLVRAHRRLVREFRRPIAVAELFAADTVRAVAALIDGAGDGARLDQARDRAARQRAALRAGARSGRGHRRG